MVTLAYRNKERLGTLNNSILNKRERNRIKLLPNSPSQIEFTRIINGEIMTRFSLLFLSFFITLTAAPTPPSFEELVKKSDFIAKTKLVNLKEKQLNKNLIAINTTAEILKQYKANPPLPNKIDLAFTVLPEVYGKWLKAPPKEGEYVIFYINKEVKDGKGKTSKIITLYEPHVFAFREWTEELEKRLLEATK